LRVSTPASASESGAVAQPANLKAPPQFVLFAFDNCDSPSFWEESLEFAERFETVGVEMKFTYFVSGAYFLTKEKSYHYAGPRHTPGASDIGFAPDKKFVSARIAQINRSIEEAHEIGSHAVGHFEGTRWTEEDWSKEFTLFNHIINNIFFFNQMPAEKFLLNPANIIGFRTPYLSYSSGLWITLNKFNYKYDTSKVSLQAQNI
jgi:peptidoglycan/xylan/chitin deacetylase (PgdA/CDA1 family)